MNDPLINTYIAIFTLAFIAWGSVGLAFYIIKKRRR